MRQSAHSIWLRGSFPGLSFGPEAFLQTHEQMDPNPLVLLQKYTAVSLIGKTDLPLEEQ